MTVQLTAAFVRPKQTWLHIDHRHSIVTVVCVSYPG